MTSVAVAPKLRLDGTHRTVGLASTLERLRPLLPAIGVTRVAVITGLDVIGVPVVTVCRPNGRSLSVSQGKGADLPAAKASGIMEAAEAWHAEHVLVPPGSRPIVSCGRSRTSWTSSSCPGSRSRDSTRTSSILWIEGTDVLTAERVWLPYECVHLDLPSGPQVRVFPD